MKITVFIVYFLLSTLFSFESIEAAPTLYTMQLTPPHGELEKWKLCAETREDLERWTKVIEGHVQGEARPRTGINHDRRH